MPEATECSVAGLHLDKFREEQPPERLIVLRVWVDATTKERLALLKVSPNHPGARGHVYELESTSIIKRGPGKDKETETDTDDDDDDDPRFAKPPKPKPKPQSKLKLKSKPAYKFKGQKPEPPEPDEEEGRLPVFPTLKRYKGKGPIASHALVFTKVEVCPRNVILLFVDKDKYDLWCQVRPCHGVCAFLA